MITQKRFEIWSLNFACKCTVAMWSFVRTSVIIVSMMTSSCHDLDTIMIATSTRNNNCNVWYLCGHDSMAFKLGFDIWVSKSRQVRHLRLPFHLFVCLSGSALLSGYRLHRLTNHQTYPKYVSWLSLGTHLLCRAKVNELGHQVKTRSNF